MGVSYLSRAARRADASVPPVSVSAQPTTASRSPLAEEDQRLNLDAGLFDPLATPSGPLRNRPLESADEPPPPGDTPSRSKVRAAHPTPTPPAADASPATQTVSPAISVAPRPAVPAAQPPQEAPLASQDIVAPRLQVPEARPSPPQVAPPDPDESAPDRADRDVARLAPGEQERRIAERSIPPVDDTARLTAALAAVERWVAGPTIGDDAPPRDGGSTPKHIGEAPAPSPIRPVVSSAADWADMTRAPRAPEVAPLPPRVEIGRIEVEIVPPPPAAERRPAPRRDPVPARPSAPFGWRQR